MAPKAIRGHIDPVAIMFLVLVPAVAHVLFSSLGFNPTDDGFTLAYSRRILDGQIPHRDFIIIRPFLSPMLHVPFVYLGGDHTYLYSRLFVWFQFACIAWSWVRLAEKAVSPTPFGKVERVSFALIAFTFSAHTFPMMPWHTVDGMFLMSIGIAVCSSEKPSSKMIGYFMIGLAYLCKQGFIFAAPLSLIILGDWRRARYALAALAPGVLYVVFLLATNSLDDAITQLTLHRDLLRAGVLTYYYNQNFLLGVMIGYMSTRLIHRSGELLLPLGQSRKEWLGLLTLSVIPVIGMSTSFVSGTRVSTWAFTMFGLVVGQIGYLLLEIAGTTMKRIGVPLLALLMGWTASLSLGYNTPALASGPVMAVLLAYVRDPIVQKLGKRNRSHVYIALLGSLSVMVVISFASARSQFVYMEKSAAFLTEPLDGILPGAKGIFTNTNTHAFLSDLQDAIEVASRFGTTHTIVPDFPGYWAKADQVNPISIDWPQSREIGEGQLYQRIVDDLDAIRETNVVIVQKITPLYLTRGFFPFPNDDEILLKYIAEHYTKVSETSWFVLYK